MSVDVAIVGAGLAGLSAARDLTAAKKTVVVLEARDRVGGRVENQLLDNGGVIELGAAFVGPTQDRVLALAEELGLETFFGVRHGCQLSMESWSTNRLHEWVRVHPVVDSGNAASAWDRSF